MLAKSGTDSGGITWWSNFELIQVEPMQVEFYLAGEITQVIDSIPWVRCASGNVLFQFVNLFPIAGTAVGRRREAVAALTRPEKIESGQIFFSQFEAHLKVHGGEKPPFQRFR